MGAGVGAAFGPAGQAAGAVFGAAYGIGSELAAWLYDDETKSSAYQAKLEKLRAKDKAKREAYYDELKFESQFEKLKSADEAAQALKALNDQLDELRMRRRAGTLEGAPEAWDARDKELSSRIERVIEAKKLLDVEAATKKEADRLRARTEIELDAGENRDKSDFEQRLADETTGGKISLLREAMKTTGERAERLAAAIRDEKTNDLTDAQFADLAARYAKSLNEYVALGARLKSEERNLRNENENAAKKEALEARQKAEKREHAVASEYDALSWASAGSSLQRAGISYGGTGGGMAISVFKATSERVKAILDRLENGVGVSVKNASPVVSE